MYKDKIIGSILISALGDGFGCPNEFLSYNEIKEKWGNDGLNEPLPGLIKITDDTQMSIAVLDALNASLKQAQFQVKFFQSKLILEFIKWYESPTNNRYPGITCLNSIKGISEGKIWKESTSIKSKGCGANMRVYPIGLLANKSKYFDETLIGKLSQMQAVLTHAHPTAIVASELTSLTISKLIKGVGVENLLEELIQHSHNNSQIYHEDILKDIWKKTLFKSKEEFIEFGWNQCIVVLNNVRESLSKYKNGEDPCGYIGDGWIAEQAFGNALLCFLNSPSNSVQILKNAVNSNGDSDSIGCIAGAFAGVHNGVKSVPKEWLNRLELKEKLIESSEIFY